MFDKSQPLWLPKGSVRAIIALLLVAVFSAIAFMAKVVVTGDNLVAIVTMVVGFYFIDKARQNTGA